MSSSATGVNKRPKARSDARANAAVCYNKTMQVCLDPNVAYGLLEHEQELVLDIETTGFSPYQDRIGVISLYGSESKTPCVISCRGGIPEPITALLRIPKTWLTHNGTTFDLLFLDSYGIKAFKHYDTLIAEQVMNTQARHDRTKDLGATMKRRLGKSSKMSIEHGRWMNEKLTVNQIKYCAEDIQHILDIRDVQTTLAKQRGLETAMQNEQRLTLSTVKMQARGMRVDPDALSEHNVQMIEDGYASQAKINEMFPGLNPNSHVQIKKAFASIGHLIENTKASTLEDLAVFVPLAADILTARRGMRQNSYYGPGSKFDRALDGDLIHTRYWQVGTETVRYSASDPSLQQIPRKMRPVFRALPGYKVVKVDYGQLEVRVAAHIADDSALIDACRNSDVHTAMAANAFQIPIEEVTKEQRQQSKACTFIWLFDGSVPGIVNWAYINHIDQVTDGVASEMLRGVRKAHPGVNKFHSITRGMAKTRGVVSVGLPWGHERQFVGKKAQTQIANTYVQGTAAVIMKQAILDLDDAGLLDYIGATVHDEVVSTCVPEKEAEEYAREVARVMEHAGESICHRVPIVADPYVGDTWV